MSILMEKILNADLSLMNLLYDWRDPWLVKIFLGITMLGKWWVAAAITLAAAFIFYFKGHKKYIIPLFISVGGSFLTGVLAKYIWQRPRPLEAAVYMEKSWSFPSGHAILAVALYGFLVYFFWKEFKKSKIQASAFCLGAPVILLIGFSRLYLGVHYLSDVLAGYLVGFAWLFLSVKITNKQNKFASTQEVEANKEISSR